MTALDDDSATGRVTDGEGDAANFIEQVADLLEEAVGFRVFPGTLNLDGVDSLDHLETDTVPLPGDPHCDGLDISPCRVGGVRAAVIRPLVPDYPGTKTELVAPVRLRTVLRVEAGDEVVIAAPGDCEPTPALNGHEADRFDGVVFDLDGTLVDLDVDWPAVHERLESLLDPYLDGPITDHSRVEVFDLAREHGLDDELEDIVGSAEVAGAETARKLPALSVLPSLDCPVGVCTANAEEAARRALDRFDVLDHVDSVVARDTMAADKPERETLSRSLEELGIDAGNALYVGDEDGDRLLAVAVGTSYCHVEQFSV
ncbi:DUF120 domain-containing protein [Haloarchaeobius litoreus]|uniref:DUF120 domain-containing protein n=1 Tax=Haloarchaeobius litoreus TaxID=755306 RepID=A0ABD6DP75_9EURY|nr:DUF120 domain-containing protein [Haloarchaeobius litoreus]